MTNTRNSMDSSRTRIGQDQEQYKPEGDYYYNNYNTRSQACSELPGEEIMMRIAEEYRGNISEMITNVAASIIEEALRNGMEPNTVILAIRETGMASRPSPYYLKAVLRRWARAWLSADTARTRTSAPPRRGNGGGDHP